MQQGLGLGWVISALARLAVLFGVREAAEVDQASHEREIFYRPLERKSLMNPYLCILVALLSTANVGLAQVASHSAIITGEVHNPPSREIEFRHEPLLAPGPSEHYIVLDEQNRFALLLNIPKGVLGTGHYKGEQYFRIPFFVEPGDSLHAVVTFAEVTEADSAVAVESDSLDSAEDEASSPYSLTFSGRGAENNRFLAEFWPQYRSFRPDNALEPEEFARQVKQQRRDEFALLAEGRERYALSPGFIDYMTAFLNYKWATQTISYPMFVFRNGDWVFRFNVKPSERRAVPPDYYDFLQEIPLIDETAIGVRGYRSFLVSALDLEAKWDRPPRLADRYKLSGLGLSPAVHAQLDSMYDVNRVSGLSQKIDLSGLGLSPDIQSQLYSILAAASSYTAPGIAERYDLAKQKLQGRVLYWFLAGELRNGIRDGYEAYVDARWQSFAESNPFPEYTEAIKAVFTLQPGQPAPDFTLHDPDGQPVSLSQFKGKVVLLDFWASWCGPCIADLGTLRKIKEQVTAQPVVFLNVSLDANDGAWKQAIAKHQIKGVHVRSGGHSEQVAQAYNVSSLPRYYLVDPQGLIVENNLSLFDTDEVVAKIEENL